MHTRRLLTRLFLAACAIGTLAIAALGAWGLHRTTADWSRRFFPRASPPRAPTEVGADGDLAFVGRDGSTVLGRLRLPRRAPPPWGAVVLMGGLRTGRRAASLVPDADVERGFAVLSLDYHLGRLPPPGRDASWYHYLGYPAALENSAEDVIDAADWLAGRADVDPRRLVMVGVSFGMFVGPAAVAAQPRYRAMALIYGGAPVGAMARANLGTFPAWSRPPLGWLADVLMAPLEPLRHLPRIECPVLLVGSTDDEQVPAACLYAVRDALRGPKEVHLFQTSHISPAKGDLIARLASDAMTWLDRTLPRDAGARAAP